MKVKVERHKFTHLGGDTVWVTKGRVNDEGTLDFWGVDCFTIIVPSMISWEDLTEKWVPHALKEKERVVIVDVED